MVPGGPGRGDLTSPRDDSDMFLAVLHPDGELDSTVGTAGVLSFDIPGGQDDSLRSLRLDSRGRLVVYGATGESGANDIVVLRLQP